MTAPRRRVLVIQHQIDSGPGVLERPLREAGLEVDFWFPESEAPPEPGSHDGYLSLGSLAMPDDDLEYPWLAAERALIERAVETSTPFLGVCLGGQLLAQVAGGGLRHDLPEHGFARLQLEPAARSDPLMRHVPDGHMVLEWHDVALVAPGESLLASSERADQAFRVGECAWGVQFHLEANLEVATGWMVASRETLFEAGQDPDALRAEASARDARSVEVARKVASAFADVVLASRANGRA